LDSWIDLIAFILLVLAAGGLPLLFLLILPFWLVRSIWQGLQLRTRRSYRVEIEDDVLVVHRDDRARRIPFDDIARGRHAENGNWTESKLVDDALTLYDADGRRLAKFPAASEGFDEALEVVERRGVPVDLVVVSAPAFLD